MRPFFLSGGLEDDPEREMQRATRADERTGQLEISARVNEQPRILLTESEQPELVEAPTDDALILERKLGGEGWEFGCGHVPALTSECATSLLAERKRWLQERCARLSPCGVRVARQRDQGGNVADYTIKRLEDVTDVLGDYPGEMRMMTRDLEAEQVAFTYRRMPQHTGGKGSYGHRHKEQEEIYFVASGKLLFKLDDEILELERGTAVRVAPETWRSVWNDEPEDAELIIVSKVVPGGSKDDAEYLEDFWPE
jgi:mannose-6-phosphate isomerase-like protein (cupin superfamily)